MRIITTTKCRAHRHPEFSLFFDPGKIRERDVQWFVGVLEDNVASGTRYQIGESVQIGWMWAWMTALPDGTYGFEEPDMKTANAVVRQPGLTNSLGHLRFQKDTLESVLPAKALSFPSFEQTCLVCTRFEKDGPFFLDRRNPAEKDSGWVLACQSDHDHNTAGSWQKTWLYSALVGVCWRALPYLAFPSGSVITVDEEDSPAFFLNDPDARTGAPSVVCPSNLRISSCAWRLEIGAALVAGHKIICLARFRRPIALALVKLLQAGGIISDLAIGKLGVSPQLRFG